MKNKKIKMKNSTLLIAAGGVFLILGVFFMITQKQNTMTAPASNGLLTQEEANALINDTTKNVIDIYESPAEVFEVKEPTKIVENTEETEEEETATTEETTRAKEENQEEVVEAEHPDYYEVTNYDEVVKKIFTEKGIKELEGTKFDDKDFVIKEDNKVFILKEIPEENRYKGNNVSIGTTKILKESVTSEVTITTYKLNDDMLTYYVIVKNLSLVKQNDTWLVDSFNYTNK